jgi:uncharacterized membrane protein
VARWLAPILVVLPIGWLALIVAAPFLPVDLAGMTYALGSLICHQIPERSFHLQSYQLPVCARCVGLYSGGALAAAYAAAPYGVQRARRSQEEQRWSRSVRGRVLVTTIAAVPTILTVVSEWAGVWKPSNTTRALAGATLGFAVALIVVTTLLRREEA